MRVWRLRCRNFVLCDNGLILMRFRLGALLFYASATARGGDTGVCGMGYCYGGDLVSAALACLCALLLVLAVLSTALACSLDTSGLVTNCGGCGLLSACCSSAPPRLSECNVCRAVGYRVSDIASDGVRRALRALFYMSTLLFCLASDVVSLWGKTV